MKLLSNLLELRDQRFYIVIFLNVVVLQVMRFAAPGRQLYKAEVDSVKALNVVGKRVEQASVSITTAKGKVNF